MHLEDCSCSRCDLARRRCYWRTRHPHICFRQSKTTNQLCASQRRQRIVRFTECWQDVMCPVSRSAYRQGKLCRCQYLTCGVTQPDSVSSMELVRLRCCTFSS